MPVLGGSEAYALSEGMVWRRGRDGKAIDAIGFYGVIAFSVLPALVLSLSPMHLIKALYCSAVRSNKLLNCPIPAPDQRQVRAQRQPSTLKALNTVDQRPSFTPMVASPPKSTPRPPGKSPATSRASSPATSINIGINESQRQQIAEGLGLFLADSFVLYGKTHGFHWNVTGPMFNSLHLMFMDQYTEMWAALDVIAERIRALGFPAPYGAARFAELATLPETEGVPDALVMVHELVTGHEAVVRTARGLYPMVDAANDQPTADLLTQRVKFHEKSAWMLRSLLED